MTNKFIKRLLYLLEYPIRVHKKYNNRIIPYKKDLELWYQGKIGPIDLDNPKTFNEKIQWLKLYDSTPIKTKLADKYLVRDWVAEKIGKQYLIPLLGVYDSFEEIDFDKLPNQFVIKCNHGCGYNIIVKDKSKLDFAYVKEKLDYWMKKNFVFKHGYELHYRDIQPKIIIEKFIENKKSSSDLNDFKFYCFNGEVKYIQVISERTSNSHKVSFYDLTWNKQKWWDNIPFDGVVEKPKQLEQMITLAKILCKGFSFVRVDLYYLDTENIYFGEMTFTPSSGSMNWSNKQTNFFLGKWIKLPRKAYNIDTGVYYKPPKHRNINSYLLFPYYFLAMLFKKHKNQ